MECTCRQEITVFNAKYLLQTSPTLVYTLTHLYSRVSILTRDIDCRSVCTSSPSIVSKLLYSKSFFTIILITLNQNAV